MQNDGPVLVIYFLACLLVFLLGVVITRAIFSIGKILANVQAQTKYLEKIALKSGVDPIDVIEIKKRYHVGQLF